MKNNNYPTWLVPIEIAKELKEIGFEEECHFFWNFYEDVNKMCCYADISEEDDDFLLPNTYNYNNKNSTGYYVYLSLPTREQVLEWFINKGFIGTIVCFRDASLNKPIYIFEIKDEKGYLISSSKNITEKYEKAREELINKLIELYGNNI